MASGWKASRVSHLDDRRQRDSPLGEHECPNGKAEPVLLHESKEDEAAKRLLPFRLASREEGERGDVDWIGDRTRLGQLCANRLAEQQPSSAGPRYPQEERVDGQRDQRVDPK